MNRLVKDGEYLVARDGHRCCVLFDHREINNVISVERTGSEVKIEYVHVLDLRCQWFTPKTIKTSYHRIRLHFLEGE